MKTTRPSDEEAHVWRLLDENIQRDQMSQQEMDELRQKLEDDEQAAYLAKRDDGCLWTVLFLPLLLLSGGYLVC
jgi:predicted N-acetyltransferase YhbS